jgi:hypothetical protein
MKFKFYVSEDEWWPMYEIAEPNSSSYGPTIELTSEEWFEYQEAVDRFCAWQDRFKEAYLARGNA